MCIIIDANALGDVFNSNSQLHDEFKAVRDWILNGKGKVVYGGSKYRNELRRTKYFKLIGQLKRARKAVVVDKEKVNAEQARIEALLTHPDFDDPHLIAIVCVSRCKLICSKDKRAYRFLKDKQFYPKGHDRPKIYSQKSNSDLLTDVNIADICLPSRKTSKEQRRLIAWFEE